MSNNEINIKIEAIKRDLELFKSRSDNTRLIERDVERLKTDLELLNEVINNIKNEININKSDIISLKERIEFFIRTLENNHERTTEILDKLTEQNEKQINFRGKQESWNRFIFLGLSSIIAILIYILKFFIGI